MNQSLKICLVSYEYPPVPGGEGAYTYGIFKSLLDIGHEVIVITANSNNESRIISVPTINITPFKLISFKYFSKKKISWLIKNGGLDIIHYTNDYFEPSIPPEAKDIPLILTVHHPIHTENRIFKKKYGWSLYYIKYLLLRKVPYLKMVNRIICEKADSIITVSKCTASEIIDNRVQQEKVTVIPNAVDIKRFNPDVDSRAMKERIGLISGKIILFVGRLDHNKGIIYLLDAFEKLAEKSIEISLLIAGKGPLEPVIRSFIKKHNLEGKVRLLGKVTDQDLPALYNISDIVVLPSLIEGFGIVLLEAMASGKPCITTKACGTEEVVVENETGVIVPIMDNMALARALQTLIADRERMSRYGEAGLKRIKDEFTWERVARKTEEVYYKAIDKKKRSG